MNDGVYIILNNIAVTINNANNFIPKNLIFSQNYPNPFNPSTNIRFSIPNPANIQLVVYNQLGQIVKNIEDGQLNTGEHIRAWNGTNTSGANVAAGVYFYQLLIDGRVTETKKMLLVK